MINSDDPEKPSMESIVVDTGILTNGEVLRLVKEGALDGHEIIIPDVVLDEMQSERSQTEKESHDDLKEITQLREMAEGARITIRFERTHPSFEDAGCAASERTGDIIRHAAKQNGAVLFTSDQTQAEAARSDGIDVRHYAPRMPPGNQEFLKFFDDSTMSVHLKEDAIPVAKRGTPGSFGLVRVGDTPLTRSYLQGITDEIMARVKSLGSVGIEISKPGATVVQQDGYRIAITTPPFSDNMEITIVHPIIKMSLEDYDISEKLMDRFKDGAEGIVISGAPGSGKSTLASGLADFYHRQDKIVKTFESPRDLQVDSDITQYTKLGGSFENSADILLLVRPDYTIFDEVRRREDFETYADLRLTGVGMVGVVHGNSPIDAIQRFIGKVELGMIPSVLDTVVHVKDGKISGVYDLKLQVKVPSGMTEQDLARPVIVISNFEDCRPEYEVYTFGEENVIMPISQKQDETGISKLARDKIRDIVKRLDPGIEVKILSQSRIQLSVPSRAVPSIIGRGGANIRDLEKQLSLRIDVVKRDESDEGHYSETPFEYSESRPFIIFTVDKEHAGREARIHVRDELVASSRIGRKGHIKISKRSADARRLLDSAASKDDIKIEIQNF